MMKQNPAQYRRQTGLNMTDEQIIAQANHLEQVAKNPAMKKQFGVMNKFMQCLNEKQKDVWNKCYSGTYIPTESEMKMLQPLLTEQRDIVQELAASLLSASGAMTPERINQLINAAASSDPKMMVAMATKSDLDSFKINTEANTKMIVFEAVDPIKDKIVDIRARILKLEAVPQVPITSGGGGGDGGENKNIGDLQRQMDEMKENMKNIENPNDPKKRILR